MKCEICGREEWAEGASVFDPQNEDEFCMARSAPYFLEDCGGDNKCYLLGIDRLAEYAQGLEDALLGYVKEHDRIKQAKMPPEYSTSECDCDLCCAADLLVRTDGPPNYTRVQPIEATQ